ncbi:hypothetical protein HBI25_219510 [Parastagonospora nodorum]|nr:hypothetical protein HBH49_229880 [Parastagonospora nodorum]KAH4082261.1 hypothetical protein HBH46_221810 [Parastagonospora nodorum]KAH4114135.1 hypothetical protein HBH47_201180 [Parastagonospora nodorum]KAH4155449.1 hypothetical protein HBH43_212640 [Parastagonospora nodorum]KAH4204592.1 hypothetical protein HBI95_146570 [Parastagonospora nodorum]
MPESAANSHSRVDPPHAPAPASFSAPPSNNHAPAAADSGALPPALTPATTTRQSVALGVFSTLWGTASSSGPAAHGNSLRSAVPTITTHEPFFNAHEGPSDLAESTGSVPSATTTLTNTLPPTQSAALRALNAPAFHSSPAKSKSAKSTSSRTTVTSQPVVVRTYSGSRHTSRPASGFNTPRSLAMSGLPNASILSAGLAAGRSEQLPSAEDFSFSAILRAVDPEIRDAIDAIAEICARSRMSLADEYDSHLPPQGEITGAGPGGWAASTGALVGRGRLSRINQGWATENTLMAVPEASSSSERLAQEKVSSSKKRSQSAYGSLKSVISGGSGKRKAVDGDTFRDQEAGQTKPQGPAWAIPASSSSSNHPAITLIASPTASKHLSVGTPQGFMDELSGVGEAEAHTKPAMPRRSSGHGRGPSTISLSTSRMRSGTLSSITSWLPWPRPSDLTSGSQQDMTRAEARLREMLLSSETIGKGKVPLSVA